MSETPRNETTPPPTPTYEEVVVDATDIAYPIFSVSGVSGWQNSKEVHRMRLAPGAHVLSTASGLKFTFTVTEARTVEYDPSLEGMFTGSGTNSLGVHGKPVALNTTELDYAATGVGGTYYTAERLHTYKLLPGNHYFVFNNQASFHFAVGQQGNVSYAPDLEGTLTGAGTATLSVHGKLITLNIADTDYYNATIGGINFGTAQTSRVYRVLPGGHYVVTSNGMIVTFTVTPQGQVTYKPEQEGILTGTGTTTLAVHGFPITLNTTDIDYYNNTISGTGWKTPDTNRTYRLLPGVHQTVTAHGIGLAFTVTPQGHVTYKPEYEGILTGTGTGTGTLTLHGLPITLNTTDIDYYNNTISGTGWKTPDPNRTYKLLPGPHTTVTAHGITLAFTVTLQGHVTYKPELEGTLTGAGTNTLAVHGFPITLDTSGVDYTNNTISATGWKSPSSNRVYKLLPGPHTTVTAHGISIPFTVTSAGRVDYKPEQASVLSGAGSTTLAVRGHEITFDLRSSAYTKFIVSGVAWRTGQLVTLRLVPGVHTVTFPDGKQYTFRVTEPGFVDYDPGLDAVLSGRGSSTLVVRRARRKP